MSEQQKKKQEKANTDAWKLKQLQKKKQKEAGGEEQSEKKNKKKQKVAKKEEGGKVQKKEEQVCENVPAVKIEEKVPYKPIMAIEDTIYSKYSRLYENHRSQQNLLMKAVGDLLRQTNTILHITSNKQKKHAKSVSTMVKCKFVEIPDFTATMDNDSAEMVCRYEDAAVVLEQSAYIVFSNGSMLVKKGALNLILLAKYFKVLAIGYCGSWRFCRESPENENQIERIHGKQIFDKYDWVSQDLIDVVVLESGPLLTSQISFNVIQGYRNYGINEVAW